MNLLHRLANWFDVRPTWRGFVWGVVVGEWLKILTKVVTKYLRERGWR